METFAAGNVSAGHLGQATDTEPNTGTSAITSRSLTTGGGRSAGAGLGSGVEAGSVPGPDADLDAVLGAGAGAGWAGRADAVLLEVVRSLPVGDERRAAACEVLVGRYRGLVGSCVRRYLGSPELAEDLMQVGFVGLMKAINNFDPGLGGSLAAYAQPTTYRPASSTRASRWG